MDINTITPAIFCKNEEYWIHYVLRDLLKTFECVVMLDTGSHDRTKEIARATVSAVGAGRLMLIEEDYGDDPHRIGNSPNVLREAVKTYWMLLLAGDEILLEEQLLALRHLELDSHKHKVGMIRGINVSECDNQLMRRLDEFSADKFFDPTVRWTTTEYPFEGYGQHELLERGLVGYLDSNRFYYWHVRHCARSSLDGVTYFRMTKADYYQYQGELLPMPDGWPGPALVETPNPYLRK